MTLLQTLKSLIDQRLSVAAGEIFVMVESVLTKFEQQAFGSKQHIEHHRTLLDIKLHRNTSLNPAEVSPEEERSHSLVQEKTEQHKELHQRPEETLIVSKPWSYILSDSMLSPEQQERSSSLVQEEPEPPQIKEEQMEELLQRPDEANDSILTFPGVTSEDDDDENRKTEPLASTSTEHTNTQPYVKGFNLKDNAEKHIRTHTGETPFTCTVCGKGYSQKYLLNRHMRVHTGEKPICCTVCGKVFAYMGNLEVHMITHTGEHPFSCPICEQKFSRKDHVRKHMSSHTWEQPFSCTVCEQRFRRRESLKRHMRTHTGENTL